MGAVHPVILVNSSRRRLSMESIARLLAENLSVIAVWLSGQTALSSLTVTRASQPRERLASSVPQA